MAEAISRHDRNSTSDTVKSDYASPDTDPYPEFPKVTSPSTPNGNATQEDSDTVPPTHKHRTLVLCFDGTGDQFDDDNSNVVNFFSLLKKDDPSKQLVYYQAGIGTYTIPQIAEPMMAKFHKAMDAMIGKHLNAHVMSGYEFLMQNYQTGDRICIFGFSRGAYTARALAGMIHKVGLLPKSNYQQVPFAYKMYSREDETGWRQSTAFKKAFSIDVDIYLLGVWDTVGSVGVIPRRLPFTTSNTHVKHFRHAIALDEHRVRFTPNFWNRPSAEERMMGAPSGPNQKARKRTMKDYERQYTGNVLHFTDVEEVWFAGCHCDVGGGAVKNEIRHNLARIPLRWMIRQCFLLDTGIMFNRESFRQVGMDHRSLWPVVVKRPPPLTEFRASKSEFQTISSGLGTVNTIFDFTNEEEEDLRDVLSPINDMMKISKTWWILEVIPQRLKYQRDDDTWAKKITIHRGRGRFIPKQNDGVKIHRTVKIRMDAKDLPGGSYNPRALWRPGIEPVWVD
ncbi:hypothetical protein AX16_005323 [Volvariella volvacea WC 439]|nr:hypothetical protein AX16_005323 [Volvariella volvacea WC 439]